MTKINIALLPLDIVEENPAANISAVESYIPTLSHTTDILVLPELFSTGFSDNAGTLLPLAETMDGFTMTRLRQLSVERSIAITGSFLCRNDMDGTPRNRAFFIDPDKDGAITFYDKRHLFTVSPEHRFLTPGSTHIPIVTFRGWNIGLIICFDLRFPVWCRNVSESYDLMIVPANWPDVRYHAWKHLLIARAIENVAPYVGVNRSGADKFGTYSYLSTMAADHRGDIKTVTHSHSAVRYATFDLEEIREFRKRFPVSESADDFGIVF